MVKHMAAGFERCTRESCGGRCCRGGGVFLEEDDIARIRWATTHGPGVDAGIGTWLGEADGEMLLLTKDGSECLFLDNDGCRLENTAVSLNMDRWALKPLACWLFPMWEGADGSLNPPPSAGSAPTQLGVSDEDRRSRAEFYSSMSCGALHAGGRAPDEAFAPEIARWHGEPGRRSVRAALRVTKCRVGVTEDGPGVFALVDMNEGEDPVPSTHRATEMVRVDDVDVSEEMGISGAVAGTASAYVLSTPDGSRWARAMDSGLVDLAFLVRGGSSAANVVWDPDAAALRVIRAVKIGEELRLGPFAGRGGR